MTSVSSNEKVFKKKKKDKRTSIFALLERDKISLMILPSHVAVVKSLTKLPKAASYRTSPHGPNV